MCGVIGVLRKKEFANIDILKDMISQLKHRGPDDQSVWAEEHVGLAHSRLSIQDLSSVAHQPMFSISKRFVIVFNGEIYNFIELRNELLKTFGLQMKTHGDTEVLVNAIECWGIEVALKKIVGMFSFAVWDRKEKKMFLARDRFGEKPLYYGVLGNDFVFSSELNPICKQYKDYLNIDRNILSTYMNYCYVPTPYCIYSELKKLEPGHYLEIDSNFYTKSIVYWSALEVCRRPKLTISFTDAIAELDIRLRKTLSEQMLSDVPLGAFLSGGVDSSLVVALMQSISSQPVKSFSIGFHEKQYDESVYAKAVASHLGTDHTEFYSTTEEAIALIPRLAQIYDEPFADSSQIPTFLVSQLAKKSVTVSLSGDAGDELFGGYNRYFLANRVKSILENKLLNQLIRMCPERCLNLVNYIPWLSVNHGGDKLRKIKSMARNFDGSILEIQKNFCAQNSHQLVISGNVLQVVDKPEYRAFASTLSTVETMMLIDTLNYLTDDILVKVDRAAMAVSLETRVPFLDHRIFEFAWSLPEEYKVSSGRGKIILRELLYKYVPKKLIDRPKMGFGVPLGEWLNGGLNPWAEELLGERKIKQQGFLSPDLVAQYWKEHKRGKGNHQYLLWNILMFQQWLEGK